MSSVLTVVRRVVVRRVGAATLRQRGPAMQQGLRHEGAATENREPTSCQLAHADVLLQFFGDGYPG